MQATPRILHPLYPAIAAVILLVALAGCQSGNLSPSGVGTVAVAEMKSPEGDEMGMVTMRQGPNGVLVTADVIGLAPGAHGFHIHEIGDCTPDFSAAGGHFAPEEKGHGYMHPDGDHAGDMPNIYAAADGTAKADVFTNEVTLASGLDNSLMDDDGSAIIIHEKADAYTEDSGTAGKRISCGVIVLLK